MNKDRKKGLKGRIRFDGGKRLPVTSWFPKVFHEIFFMEREARVILCVVLFFLSLFILTLGEGSFRRTRNNLTVGVFSGSYWDVQNGNTYKIVDDAIEAYEKKYPNIKVTYESGVIKSDYTEWLSERIMSGSMPDVVFILGQDFSSLAEMGALKNLNSLVKKDRSFRKEAYFRTAWKAGEYEGKQYALPYECAPQLMFVNKTILDKEGISMPESGWKWSDFYRICRNVTTTGESADEKQYGVTGYDWNCAFNANGVDFFEHGNEYVDFTVPGVTESLELIEKLNELNHGYKVSEADFSEGNVVFQPMPFSQYRAYKSQELHIKKYSGFEWDCLTMPAGPNGDNVSELDTLCIGMSAGTNMEAEAWNFMKLISSDPDVQKEILEYSDGLSVVRDVTLSDEASHIIVGSSKGTFNMKMLEKATDNSVVVPRFRGCSEVKEQVDLAVRSILDGEANIETEQIIWNREINNYLQTLN